MEIRTLKIAHILFMITLSFHLNPKSLYGAFPSDDRQNLSLQDSTPISNSLFSDVQFGIHIGQVSETKGDSYQYFKWGFSINPCLSRYFGFIIGWSQIKTDHQLHQIIFQNPPSLYTIPTMYGATILSYGFRISIPIQRSSFLLDLYRLNRNKYDHKTGFGYNIGFQFMVVKQIYLSLSYENNIYNFDLVCGANTDFYNGYKISLKYGLKIEIKVIVDFPSKRYHMVWLNPQSGFLHLKKPRCVATVLLLFDFPLKNYTLNTK